MTSNSPQLTIQANAPTGALTIHLPPVPSRPEPSPNMQQDRATFLQRPQASVRRRNMEACARCSEMHKKCNMHPPYSRYMCQECAKAGHAECPPHKPRRRRGRRARKPDNQAVESVPFGVMEPLIASSAGRTYAPDTHPITPQSHLVPAQLNDADQFPGNLTASEWYFVDMTATSDAPTMMCSCLDWGGYAALERVSHGHGQAL